MATEDEAREAADGTEVQVEAVDLGTVHLQAHPEGKLSSLMEIKSMGETIDSTEGTLKIPEDQVLVEAPSDDQLPPEHNLNGEASSLNGHTDKEEKISNEQPHDNDQEEAELDQSNGINKEDVTDGLSHGESTTEDSCLLKHKNDEEPKGDDQQDLGVTVDDDPVQEDTLKTDNAIEQTDDCQQDQNQEPEKANENTEPASITNNADVDNAIEQTDDGQQDQNQEPEKANENTQPASIANNADVEIVAEAPTGLQAPVEKRMNDSDGIPETIDEKTETDEPAKADGVVHPEEVAKVEDQQSQQADTMDADVASEEIKCEETDQQEEKPKSEAHEPTIDAQGVLNQESAEETDDPINEKIEETAHQRNVAVPKETTLEHEATMSAPSVNTQVQNQESLEVVEDTEAEIQPSSGFGDAIPEDQSNLGVTIDNDTVNEDTLRAIEQQDDGQQDEDLEPKKATEHTQSASTTDIPHVEIVTEAPSGVQTPREPNLDNSDAVPDTIDANTETDEPAKAHAVVHPDQKESFPEDTSTAEPTEEVVKAEDQQSQQADAMDANMVQEEVPKSEHADEPATDALEVLNQESAEETDGPVNEKTEETSHQSNMPASDTTDGNRETDEPAKAHDVVHPDKKESFPEDTSTIEPTEEVLKLEEQQSQQADAMDADLVQEEVPKSKHTDEPATDALEVLNQESAEETDGPVNGKTEEIAHQSNMPASEETTPEYDATRELPVTIQVQNHESLEEREATIEEREVAEAVDTEATMQQSIAALEEAVPEDDTSTPNAPHAGTEPVRELESVEDSTDTMEHPGETHGSTSDELTPTEENTTVTEPSFNTQEVQNLTSQEIKDGEDDKTDEFSYISSFPTPGEADQVPRIEPTPDVQEVQVLGLTEETRDIEAVEPEDQQEHIVCTLEKPAVDGEPNADDQQVHEDKLLEVEDNKAIEADEASKQSNIATPDNAAEGRNELESDPDSYTQPTEQVELSKDNENSQLVKADETSGQSNSVTLEERTTEDSVASEIDPPVDIKQEPPVEEIKGVDATEAEEDFHTRQSDAIEKLASDSNIATIEPTYDIQQVDDLEATEEKKNAKAINDGEQSNIAVSEEPTPTDNGATPEDHHVESNEGMIGNETDNVILAHGIKDEIQKSAELKDDACDLGDTVLTTQRSENKTDEDAVQTSGNDTLETSNNIHQVKEEPNAVTEHNSSQMSSECNGENTTHVQDRDVEGQVLTESGTAEASQTLFKNDPQAAQDTTQKDDTTKGSEQTSDHDSRQHGDVALQQQSCETDALSIEKQDEALQKIDSDQKEKEDEEIESQNDEFQVDEQKHEDKRDDLTTEPLVEYQNFENGATNRTEDNDAFEAEQREAAISEILKNEKALHISKETSEGTEEDDDGKNDNKDEKENAENDDIVAKTSNEQGETTDEIRNEELKSGLASSVQEASDPAPSKDKILEKDPVHVIQASEKEIADEIEESKEIHEDNAICHDELQTNSEKEESPQLLSNEQYNVDAKIDDTTPLCEEKIHDNASIKPREIEEIGEDEGLDSTSEPSVESSIQNNVEDSSSHHKVEDEKLSMSEKNDVDTEAMQEKNDESTTYINQTEQCQEEINEDDVLQLETEKNSFDKIEETASHEETETSSTAATEAVAINEDITDKVTGADGAPSNESLKTFTDTRRDLDVSLVITTSKEESVNDNMENLNLDLPGHLAQDGNTPEKVLSLEETEREMPPSEKLLQTEPGENQIPNEQDEKDIQDENQTPKEKNEEDMQDTEIGEAKKEVEQELPVSHFLINLILGKESSDANEDSESEAATKQGEATEDGSCACISKQEESLGSLPTENKVDDNLTFVEQEKHEVKCSEETQEMVKEQSDDLKLDTERSIETDEDIKKNTHDLEIPAYQDNPQDEISGKLLTGEAAGVSTKMGTRDIDISSVELDDRAVGTVCQKNMEVSTKNENGSLRSSLNDSINTKAPEEDTLGEGQTGLVLESLPEDKSVDAVSEQAPSLTESRITDANDLSSDTASVQNPVSAKQDKPTESSNVEATCSIDIQLENEEVDKKDEEQHANTATDEVSEENVESSHVNLQKITSSEVTPNELATQITEPVCDTQTILAHEKEISEENFPTAVETQADGPNMQINQDKQDDAADSETAMEPEKLRESNFQEHQETSIEQKSPKETDEGDQQLLAKKEIPTQEQDVHERVESPRQAVESPKKIVSIKSNEDQELFDSKVQECDLNVVSPREAAEAEENFMDVTKPEFSTDEEQSPKAHAEEKVYDEKIKDSLEDQELFDSKVQEHDLNVVSPREAAEAEENFVDVTKPEFSTDEEQSPKAHVEEKVYDKKIKDIEGTKNFTDEAAMKTEVPGAAQKARKKQGLLSGVGSKVKHQLAKVKKAIVGKPGRTKPESPKA